MSTWRARVPSMYYILTLPKKGYNMPSLSSYARDTALSGNEVIPLISDGSNKTTDLASVVTYLNSLNMNYKDISTSTYDVTQSDNGLILVWGNTGILTLRLPNNLSRGFRIGLAQAGTGQISVVALTGATLFNRQGYTKTAGQYARGGLEVMLNTTGSGAQWWLYGDTGA